MRNQKMSVRTFLILLAVCEGGAALVFLTAVFEMTGDVRLLFAALFFSGFLFLCQASAINFFKKTLLQFTGELCGMLDDMMNGEDGVWDVGEKELLLARLGNRISRLYRVLRESWLRAEREKKELQTLVSDLSHQTKTPIANLRMINETLQSREMDEAQRRRFLEAQGSQLEKLDFVIRAMVKTQRLEVGVIALEKREVPIQETLADAINGVLALLEQKKLKLQVDCPEDLIVSHDTRWTAEALFNLLDNAVKYTPEGGRICVSVQSWEMYVKIDVTDSGIGIPEPSHAAVFQRFYRGPGVHETDGVGIGLYLAREIITMQGGYIKLTSELQKGSTFSVFLPGRRKCGDRLAVSAAQGSQSV